MWGVNARKREKIKGIMHQRRKETKKLRKIRKGKLKGGKRKGGWR